MATYTVIQDIEAEDKLFGPLTLKQFIFACMAILFGYLSFWSTINGFWILLVVFLLPTLLFAVLAFPYTKDQSTEVWLAAKIRFFFRPRKRIWDQSGTKHLVTITVPKKDEHIYTDGLSHTQIKSRLRALGDTLDSRGWAVKNTTVSMSTSTTISPAIPSDRLVAANSRDTAPAEIIAEIRADDDIYDQVNNPTAHHLEEIIQTSEQQHRQQISSAAQKQPDERAATQKQNDYWFMREQQGHTPSGTAHFSAPQLVIPGQASSSASGEGQESLTEQEQAALEQIHKQQNKPNPMNSHLKTIKPLSDQKGVEDARPAIAPGTSIKDNTTPKKKRNDTGKDTAKAVKMNLARDNNLSVETISKEANKANGGDGEVVVSLH